MSNLRKAFFAISHPTTANTRSRPIILYRRQPNGKFKTSVLVTALKRVLNLTGSSPTKYVTVDWAYNSHTTMMNSVSVVNCFASRVPADLARWVLVSHKPLRISLPTLA